MSPTRYLPLLLPGVLGLTWLAAAQAAEPPLGEAIKALHAKYLKAPEIGTVDNSPKIVAGGGEEGTPLANQEISLGPLRVTLTYEEAEPEEDADRPEAEMPEEAGTPPPDASEAEESATEEPPVEDIPEEATLPGEMEVGETAPRAPVVTVYFSDPGAPASQKDEGEGKDGNEAADEAASTGARVVATLKGDSAGFSDPPVSVQIAELDPNNPYPEVVVSFFTGGAHCCSLTSVVTSDADGAEWREVDVGEFDGGPMVAVDLDGDKTYEFETRDNAFLYAFGCYACSEAPLQVLALKDGKIADMSDEERFKPAHAAWLKNMITAVPEEDVNGFLAGYVGEKIRLGEGKQAWDLMLKYYDRNSDWGLEICEQDYDENGDCPVEPAKVTFPQALEHMLNENGYKIGG